MPSDWSVISRVIPLTQPKWRCLTLVTLELLRCSWKRLLQHLLPQFSFLHPFMTLTNQTTSKMFCGETGTRDREERWKQYYSYWVILPLSCRLPLGSQGSFLFRQFFLWYNQNCSYSNLFKDSPLRYYKVNSTNWSSWWPDGRKVHTGLFLRPLPYWS